MKILYFLDYGKELGGAAHTLMIQALLMREAGHEVKLFLSDYYGSEIGSGYLSFLTKYNLQPGRITYHISSEPEDVDVVSMDENYEEVRNVIESEMPDLIHSVQLNTVVELISRELSIPHIMSIYPLSKSFFEINWMDVFPRYLICDSYYWAEQWKKYLGVNYACIRTVVYDFPKLREERAQNDFFRCICVGALYEGKNQYEVIKGFHKAIIKGVNGTLFLYGQDDGQYANECRRYIMENKLQDCIKIQGFCENMPLVYAESDVLICGSKRESYPNVVSEAMANSLIVLSTPVGGVPEIISNSENGYLTDGYESDDFCSSLIRIYKENKETGLNQIRTNAYMTAKKEHASNSVSKKLESYYKYVIDDYKRCNKKTLMINDIRKTFNMWIAKQKESESLFRNKMMVREKLWYLYYVESAIRDSINSNREFYIWGAGNVCETVLQIVHVYFEKMTVKGIIDSNKTGSFKGYSIVHPNEALKKDLVVLIGLINGQWDVVRKLEKNGMKHGVDYFFFAPRLW